MVLYTGRQIMPDGKSSLAYLLFADNELEARERLRKFTKADSVESIQVKQTYADRWKPLGIEIDEKMTGILTTQFEFT